MSQTQIVGSVAFSLGDDIRFQTHHWDSDGRACAALTVDSVLAVHVTDASPEVLGQLADKLLELKAWREQQLAATEGGA